MTVTKQALMKALAQVDDLDVIYIDNGIDCMECRGITVMRPANGSPKARMDLYESVSGLEDGQMVPDGSIVLRLAN